MFSSWSAAMQTPQKVSKSLRFLAALLCLGGTCGELYASELASCSDQITPEAVVCFNQLGTAAWKAGRIEEASKYFRQALAAQEKLPGVSPVDVAKSINNLAVSLQHLGRYTEAESLFRRSLSINENALGLNHPEVSLALDNLGLLLLTVGRYDAAEPVFQRALAINEKSQDKNSLALANSLNNLAVLKQLTGQSSEARPLLMRALVIREKILGPDHPDVANNLNDLAVLIQTSGEYSEAEPLLRRALAIREKVLGVNHPEVAVSLNNLADYLKGANRAAEAEPLLLRAHDIAVLAKNPELLQQIQASLMRYYRESKPGLAIAYGRQAVNNLQRLREGLANTSPENQQQYTDNVARTYYTLANLLKEHGREEEASRVLNLLDEDATFSLLR